MTPLTPLDRRVLEELTKAAASQIPCPSNAELARLIGKKSETSSVEALQRLEARGMIAVERFGRARTVTILATGQATEAPRTGRRPHYQYRDKSAAYTANADPVSRETLAPPGPLFRDKTP